ncbi:hypothetical protein BOQ07_30610, partial [Klebsiella michiganensis]
LMMSLWDALRMNMMISYQELVRTFLSNPTPYYQTVTELNAGKRVLENALVPPLGETSVKLPSDAGSEITYRTINDYGALTPKMTGKTQ